MEATHARPRLVAVRHPTAPQLDGFWLAGGRLVDWGPLDDDPHQLHQRTAAALRRAGRIGELGAHVPPDEIDEVRIVGSWLASHPDTPQLALRPAPDDAALAACVHQSASAPEPDRQQRTDPAPEPDRQQPTDPAPEPDRQQPTDPAPEPEPRGASALEGELDDDRLDLVGADRDR
jgi:hypothetical protein